MFDIGAHHRIVGLMLGHRVGPTGQVVVVENPHNLAACARNAELNDMPWVVPHQAAVGDRNGTMQFTAGFNGQAGELSDYGGLIEVPAVTIDVLTAQYGIPDIVFIDIEGFECRALVGAQRTITAKPDWFVEVHVGFGLEKAAGSVEQVLAFFPETTIDSYIHSEGDAEPIPLKFTPPEKLRARFFLTALAKETARASV